MPQVKTSSLNANGYYDTAQACEKLMCGRSTLDTMRKSGVITKYIKRGMKYAYEANEILAIQKRMKNNGGAII